MSTNSRQYPTIPRNRVPVILIGLGLVLISLIVIQQVLAQEARTLKPPYRLIVPARTASLQSADSITLPLDAPIIMSQTFNSSYQPVSNPAQLGWHQLVGSGATSGYTWKYVGTAPLPDTVWCAGLNPVGFPQLNPATNTYTNGMEALLVYGPVDLSGFSQAVITATYWLDTKPGDFGGLAVSTDGTNFTALYAQSEADPALSHMRSAALNLSSYAGQPTVWVAFYLSSNNDNNNGRGVFIKDTVLRGVLLTKSYLPFVAKQLPPTPTPTPTATPSAAYMYNYTFGVGASNDPDFIAWGGTKTTTTGCGSSGCSYTQDILAAPWGNPPGAMTLYLQNTYSIGGASSNVVTSVNYDYSADFYIYNGQLDARYGLIFDASSSTFGSDPPFNSDRNYYKLKMVQSASDKTQVVSYQIQQCSNGGCGTITGVNGLPNPIPAGQWHNLRITQQGTTISFYLNGSLLTTAYYDPAWGDGRRKFGIFVESRGSNGDGGPLEVFFDNVRVSQLP